MTNRLPALAALLGAALAVPVRADEPKKDETPKPVATVAHIKLKGSLEEGPVAEDPLFGTSAENFKAKLERIRKAKKDAAVKALYLELDGLDVGLGKIDELTRAIADFR